MLSKVSKKLDKTLRKCFEPLTERRLTPSEINQAAFNLSGVGGVLMKMKMELDSNGKQYLQS